MGAYNTCSHSKVRIHDDHFDVYSEYEINDFYFYFKINGIDLSFKIESNIFNGYHEGLYIDSIVSCDYAFFDGATEKREGFKHDNHGCIELSTEREGTDIFNLDFAGGILEDYNTTLSYYPDFLAFIDYPEFSRKLDFLLRRKFREYQLKLRVYSLNVEIGGWARMDGLIDDRGLYSYE